MSHDREQLQEVVDRTRRIETRLTRYLKEQGFDTHPARIVFSQGDVQVPSKDCTLREIISVIPEDWDGEVFVMLGSDHIATLQVE